MQVLRQSLHHSVQAWHSQSGAMAEACPGNPGAGKLIGHHLPVTHMPARGDITPPTLRLKCSLIKQTGANSERSNRKGVGAPPNTVTCSLIAERAGTQAAVLLCHDAGLAQQRHHAGGWLRHAGSLLPEVLRVGEVCGKCAGGDTLALWWSSTVKVCPLHAIDTILCSISWSTNNACTAGALR